MQECVEGINTMQIPGGSEGGGDRDTVGVKEVENRNKGPLLSRHARNEMSGFSLLHEDLDGDRLPPQSRRRAALGAL